MLGVEFYSHIKVLACEVSQGSHVLSLQMLLVLICKQTYLLLPEKTISSILIFLNYLSRYVTFAFLSKHRKVGKESES